LHRSTQSTLEELHDVFAAGDSARGNIIIPAFAVGRTQDLLYLMTKHFDDWRIGDYKVFLDSPMAIEATTTYAKFRDHLETELFRPGTRLPNLKNLAMSRTAADSMAINKIESGAIVIAASGMCTGGRIRHHLKHNLWKSESQVVIVGYQAHGTLGRRLVDGAETVRIFGEEIRVNARIHTVGGLSAHADQAGLIDWYRAIAGAPPVCLVHGEPDAQTKFAQAIEKQTGRKPKIPKLGEKIDLKDLGSRA
jgi:metallo-beta-lactamase family protein